MPAMNDSIIPLRDVDVSNNESQIADLQRVPKATNFTQQTLPAFTPKFSSYNASIAFFILGLIFLVFGVASFMSNSNVVEITIDYTDCVSDTGKKCSESTQPCICNQQFNLHFEMGEPFYMYYELDKFYQNHRMYLKSRSNKQLLGDVISSSSQISHCAPIDVVGKESEQKIISPCGYVANSLFNDTISLIMNGTEIKGTSKGISWSVLKERKYRTVSDDAWANTVKPPNWPVSARNRTKLPFASDEEFINWMEPAALPKFRKLYRRFDMRIHPGVYSLRIHYNFPASSRKSVVLSTTSWLGGRNYAITIVCFGGGFVYISLAIILCLIVNGVIPIKAHHKPIPAPTFSYKPASDINSTYASSEQLMSSQSVDG